MMTEPLAERRAKVLEPPHRFYALKGSVSFCRVAGRMMFLDLAADRYFCLSLAADRSFARLLDEASLDEEDHAALDNLTIYGPLISQPRAGEIAPCPRIEVPSSSMLDDAIVAPGCADLLLSGASVVAAPLRLRLFGLRRCVAALRRRKARQSRNEHSARVARVAAAFARLRLFATERDNCLTRSLAVANRLVSVGARPDLVIAVKLQPFAAHAWVQCNDRLVNERYEFVREFTPILVV